MKKITLLFSFIAVIITTAVNNSNAQALNYVEPSLLVNYPAAVAGIKNFTKTNDGVATNTNNWGRAIDSIWWQIPLVKTLDSVANNSPAQPANSLTGKFAMVYRGTNQFGEKALNAQNAGAMGIIIVNNVAGGPVGMAAGNVGAQVTIPVLMISQADGDAINAQMHNGQNVAVSLTRWGFNFQHDLGIVNNSLPLFHASAIPMFELKVASNPYPYNLYTGCFIANLGTSAEVDIKLKSTAIFTPTTGSPMTIHSDSISYASTFNPIDSIDEISSTSKYNLPAINSLGKIQVNYSLSAAATDLQPGNNTLSYSTVVTDSIYSKGRINETTGDPIFTMAYRFNSSANDVWGPLYCVREGGHKAWTSQFSVSNGTAGSSLNGSFVNIYAYAWNDANGDSIIQVGELSLEGAAAKQFTTADSNYKTFSADYQNINTPGTPVVLKANTWYWIAAEVAGTMYLGCDGDINYYSRSRYSFNVSPRIHEPWAPQYSGDLSSAAATDNLMQYPFTKQNSTIIDSVGFLSSKGLVPAINLRVSKMPLGVNEVAGNTDNGLSLYPNPAVNDLNIKYQSKTSNNVTIRVIDGLGRIIYRQQKNLAGGQTTISTSNFETGTYYLVVQEEEGKMVAKKFVVVK
jgi:hypothetical protein